MFDLTGGCQHEKKKMPLGGDRNEIVPLPHLPGHPHQSNILYIPGCAMEDELGMVPSVRSSQMVKSKYIGSGAFGKVYRGFVEGLPDTPGKKEVAIKVIKVQFVTITRSSTLSSLLFQTISSPTIQRKSFLSQLASFNCQLYINVFSILIFIHPSSTIHIYRCPRKK